LRRHADGLDDRGCLGYRDVVDRGEAGPLVRQVASGDLKAKNVERPLDVDASREAPRTLRSHEAVVPVPAPDEAVAW